jgi:tetratricopeptide (TPR) repeat protein
MTFSTIPRSGARAFRCGALAVRLLAAAAFALAATCASADEIADIGKLLKGGQLDQANQKVDAYLATKPRDAQGRFLKGLILTEQNKTADAISVFTKLTEDYPELPEPYNNLAVLYAGQGQYEKAREALEMAIRTHPSYATAHENLGDVYAKLASQAYDKALSLDSSNAAAQTKLALVKELIGSGNRARGAPATPPASTQVAQNTAPPTKATTTAPAVTPPVAPPAGNPPAAKDPVKASPAPAKGPDETSDVSAAVNAWAAAWAGRDVPGYLAAYGKDFKTPKGEARANWEAERKQRIEGAAHIEVKVSGLKVSFTDANTATAKFRQEYKSNITSANSSKTLVLSKASGKWQIIQERSGG